eukprot:15136296-Alexandrium_andersonii.AAC.1
MQAQGTAPKVCGIFPVDGTGKTPRPTGYPAQYLTTTRTDTWGSVGVLESSGVAEGSRIAAVLGGPAEGGREGSGEGSVVARVVLGGFRE